MQACDVLDIIRTKNRENPEWTNRDLYRFLYNPTLHILAYERLKSKPGNMTPGSDGKTLDGYSIEAIHKLIGLLRTEQYRPTPVRRTYIPKSKGKRPLGVPSPRDKLVQECIRVILEAIYEPNFHDNSHGFRPGRSCHTALESLRRSWTGTKWAIEADLTECFERINHHRLLDILRERIQDERFINLIRKFLKAGYLENWEYHQTYSGTPQGSGMSPILTNVYLDQLDRKLEALCQQHTKGKRRRKNPAHAALLYRRKQFLIQGEAEPELRGTLQDELRDLNGRILQTPASDYNDPAYSRVRFLRYADDVIIGVTGPKALAEQIKDEVARFLEEDLKLELNPKKTRITHLSTEQAQFLGYRLKTASPRFRRLNMQRRGSPHNVVRTARTTTGTIKLLVPLRNLSKKLERYMAKGQPAALQAFVNQPTDYIIRRYNATIRGWYNYYQLAENVCQLNYARYVLHYSLAKTLATKERSSVSKIFNKYGKRIVFEKPNGRTICFFDQPMRQVKKAGRVTPHLDAVPTWARRKTQTRLLDECAICASPQNVEMHHVRHLRQLGKKPRDFTFYMASINRKQIPVCRKCHRDIHKGKYDGPSLSSALERLQARGPEL